MTIKDRIVEWLGGVPSSVADAYSERLLDDIEKLRDENDKLRAIANNPRLARHWRGLLSKG